MRDAYAVGDEAADFEAFLRTGAASTDPTKSFWPGWLPLVREAVGRGVMWRARIVSEPVTDYIRYEYAVTLLTLAAGGGRAVAVPPAGLGHRAAWERLLAPRRPACAVQYLHGCRPLGGQGPHHRSGGGRPVRGGVRDGVGARGPAREVHPQVHALTLPNPRPASGHHT